MSGPLILAGDPDQPMEATTQQYVDTQDALTLISAQIYADNKWNTLGNWQAPVDSKVASLPTTPTEGSCYLLDPADNRIAQRTSGVWVCTAPTDGMVVYDKSTDYIWLYNGSNWVRLSIQIDHNSTLGLNTGNYIHLTPSEYSKQAYLSNVSSDVQSQLDSKASLTGANFTGDVNTTGVVKGNNLRASNLTFDRVLYCSGNGGTVAATTLDTAHLYYLSNVTSDIQSQLNSKAATSYVDTGLATKYSIPSFSGNRVVLSTSTGFSESSVSNVTLGYLDATSSIQTQLNSKASTSSLSNYLTTSNAASTYLTIANAATTYLTQTDAVSTYLKLTGGNSFSGTQTLTSGDIIIGGTIASSTASVIYCSRSSGGGGPGSKKIVYYDGGSARTYNFSGVSYASGRRQEHIPATNYIAWYGGASDDSGMTERMRLTDTGSLSLTGFTANTVLVSDSNKIISSSGVSYTTLGYLDATSSIQTQLNSKANLSGAAFTGVVTASNIQSTNANDIANLQQLNDPTLAIVRYDEFCGDTNSTTGQNLKWLGGAIGSGSIVAVAASPTSSNYFYGATTMSTGSSSSSQISMYQNGILFNSNWSFETRVQVPTLWNSTTSATKLFIGMIDSLIPTYGAAMPGGVYWWTVGSDPSKINPRSVPPDSGYLDNGTWTAGVWTTLKITYDNTAKSASFYQNGTLIKTITGLTHSSTTMYYPVFHMFSSPTASVSASIQVDWFRLVYYGAR